MPQLTRFARPASIGLVVLAAAAAACSDATGPVPAPAPRASSPAAAGSDTARPGGTPTGTPAGTPADTGSGRPTPAPGGTPSDTAVTRPATPPGVIGGWALRPLQRIDTAYVGWSAAVGATVTVSALTPGDSAAGRPGSLRQVATATIGLDGAFRTGELPDGLYRVRGTVTIDGVAHAGEQTIRLAGRQQQPAFLHLLLTP